MKKSGCRKTKMKKNAKSNERPVLRELLSVPRKIISLTANLQLSLYPMKMSSVLYLIVMQSRSIKYVSTKMDENPTNL